ncbi:MAG: ligand-binding protein SH3 [Lysobacteraceae bacterium]|nr:MAG: ligand-binding protein SH3 [Xanthomonadaceae bacterium]
MPHRRPVLLSSLLFCSLLSATALAGPREDARVENASRVMSEIQAIPESAIPDKLLDEAKAIVVVPDTIKAGLVLGGRRGHGVMAVRNAEGGWSNPSFVTLTGGSIGLQVGVQSADVVLVFRGERGLDSIVNGKFTLGADAGVAAGPLGRNASASTDGQMKAEIWSWSRARGLFAGVALDGAVLSIDDRSNESVYGQDTTPRMIFEDRAQHPPSAAVSAFRDLLIRASSDARQRRNGPEGQSASPASTSPSAEPLVQPQPFETVEGGPQNPAKVEPLPETP